MTKEDLIDVFREIGNSNLLDEIVDGYIANTIVDLVISIMFLVIGIVGVFWMKTIYNKNKNVEHWYDWFDFARENIAKTLIVSSILAVGVLMTLDYSVELVHWRNNPIGMLWSELF